MAFIMVYRKLFGLKFSIGLHDAAAKNKTMTWRKEDDDVVTMVLVR